MMTVFQQFLSRVRPALQPLLDGLIRLTRRVFDAYRKFPIAYTALSYLYLTIAFSYYPVIGHWLTGFMMMSLPLAILAGFAACVYLFVKRQQLVATAGVVWVLFSFMVTKRLVGISPGELSLNQAQTLNVLSFNSETFPSGGAAGFDLASLKADIACFQEYSPNEQIEQQYAATLRKLTCFGDVREVGLALFSKYPIVNQYGRIWNRTQGPDINGFICADIAYGADTIRVVNVHLWSMGVRTNQAMDALKNGQLGVFCHELADTFHRLKEGFENRNAQFREVETYVAGSRYPVIICGDFNETPIGYSYGKLSRNFKNAFEEAGEGLGFTLNRHPYCVRIDQQFVSSDWHIKACQTLSGISFSDHFPVLAQYVLKKSMHVPAAIVAQRTQQIGHALATK
ncbi:endonuclease/exonuclease/phosphatase family protein [Fibrella sp. WM1]|uniref:endonuclease/exonuclease/phosphatase family protein n=1 Tax=Fibrella musci TaxID=3242485 RepID=UPI0035210F3D